MTTRVDPNIPTTFVSGFVDQTLRKRRRRSRWDSPALFPIPGVPRCIPSNLDPAQAEAFLLRVRLEEITYAMTTGQLGLNTGRERSPSPEPVYDKDGKRVNTRDQRARDRYTKERQRLLEQCIRMCPNFKPPSDFSRAAMKKIKKVPIPEKDYPDYNFIGLIIGPRGNTQKRLEKESGAKISIRGKGSIKEGKIKKGPQPDDDEPLHVLITADTDDQIDKAYALVMPLLTPMDEAQNEWKKQQLRELAEINGTLRDRTWMQPLPDYDANVSCAICGDASHPTTDCPFKGTGVVPTKKVKLDSEYDSFMREIGEAPKAPPPAAPAAGATGGQSQEDAEKSYKELMAAVDSVEASADGAEAAKLPGYVPWSTPAPGAAWPGVPGVPPMIPPMPPMMPQLGGYPAMPVPPFMPGVLQPGAAPGQPMGWMPPPQQWPPQPYPQFAAQQPPQQN